ncbi:hypothetical protein BDN72DRAFT_877355 [Pluteus cervinus]|uniref:Uncharacterized protein n=1 Tax=Pluteus cervinus TaxID=181527 RepID=A0ACD3B1D9_9AGAR|nr:hypothetical protein BDN72DRAFT_877355 [Pluteus cervinus]
MISRQPYSGTSRKLVIAFDVGTTFSGVSYCLLDPGQVPEIKGITRYPSQELTRSDSKIPSIIWYDPEGQVRAVGAEAVHEGVEESARNGQWEKVEWFKLHLRPIQLEDENTSEILSRTPPLPFGLTIVTVFADFLRYLLDCTRIFIQEGSPSGTLLWSSIEADIEFVISHPNGWTGVQQSQLRQAAIRAQLIPDMDAGANRLHFVTEGEASLHACITKNLTTEAMKNDGKIIIVDAGGGTIDISSYTRKLDGGKQLYEELAAPRCIVQGSVFVTVNARTYLNDFLKDSPFADIVPEICNAFDKSTKLRFRSAENPEFIKFGTPRDHDAERGISYGRLKLPGRVDLQVPLTYFLISYREKVAEFYWPAIDGIVQTIVEHRRYLKSNANTVFLVGGFAASDWLFHQVKIALVSHGVDVCRPDNHVNKMVADGGVSFFIDHYVSARIAKYAYGIEKSTDYNENKPGHNQRKATCFSVLSGRVLVPGVFDAILPKNTKVTEQEVFRHTYSIERASVTSPVLFGAEIIFYVGSVQKLYWLDEDKDNFKVLCTVEADVTSFASKLPRQKGTGGKEYYAINLDIIILFGLTELVAQIAWKEKGIEKRTSRSHHGILGVGVQYNTRRLLQSSRGVTKLCNDCVSSRQVFSHFLKCCFIMAARQSYNGTSRKLVIAFDVGTTFSGVSYCLLDPGHIPEIRGITRFPSQELTSSDSKIPSIIWYDQDGQVRAVGAEATSEETSESAEMGQWVKVEWFKLHLRPNELVDENTAEILRRTPPLPFGLTIVAVFADFLRYLLDCTRIFIQESVLSGTLLWSSIESDIEFVISHPNGWGGAQQTQLRQAAIRAQLVPDTDAGARRIHFVTEGEASLHSCIAKNLATEAMERDGKIVVVDAGGGTIDISSYTRGADGGRQLYEELGAPRCILRGSIFVTEYARRYLNVYLEDSPFAEIVPAICESFDKTTKLRFRTAEDPAFIRFGTPRDHDAEHNITYGRLRLPGARVAEFFQPAVSSIVQAILDHFSYLGANTVFLVGGFAASDWLFDQVRSAVAPHGVDVARPDSHVNKIVADGGVSFFIDHYVSARIARYAYGVKSCEDYDEGNPAHNQRQSTRRTMPSGRVSLPGAFNIILRKNTRVTEQEVFRRSYSYEATSIRSPHLYLQEILFYVGSLQEPRWLDEDRDNFRVLCIVEADLTSYASRLVRQTGPEGQGYYRVEFDIIILFGLTELIAQIAWTERVEASKIIHSGECQSIVRSHFHSQRDDRVASDVTSFASKLPRQKGSKEYYALNFDIIVLFGLTELVYVAQIAWKETVNSPTFYYEQMKIHILNISH